MFTNMPVFYINSGLQEYWIKLLVKKNWSLQFDASNYGMRKSIFVFPLFQTDAT